MRTRAVLCNLATYLYVAHFRDSRKFNTTIIGNICSPNLRHLGPVYCDLIAYRAGKVQAYKGSEVSFVKSRAQVIHREAPIYLIFIKKERSL